MDGLLDAKLVNEDEHGRRCQRYWWNQEVQRIAEHNRANVHLSGIHCHLASQWNLSILPTPPLSPHFALSEK